MALDALVDSTQLDADLTSVANAIRTKGGTSAQLAFPAEFVSAIEDIETGGGGVTPPTAVCSVRLVRPDDTDEVSVDYSVLPYASNFNQFCQNNGYNATVKSGIRKLTIVPPEKAIDTSGMFYCDTAGRGNYLQIIVIKDRPFKILNKNNQALFGYCHALKTIDGLIDLSTQAYAVLFSATNNSNMFRSCEALETVSFVPGSMKFAADNWVWSWQSNLTDESLVSIANALLDTYTGTITFHNTPKARLASIMGTVSSDGTLSTFAIDENGTVSLQDFLTVTKGATIA